MCVCVSASRRRASYDGLHLQQIGDTLADTLRQVADILGIDPLLWKRYLRARARACDSDAHKCDENRDIDADEMQNKISR